MNQTTYKNSSISEYLTLDEFLDTLGFSKWITITTSFVLPIVNVIGLVLCSLSLWIFSQSRFKNPTFFYYRLLTIVYILSLFHNIPAGLLFSPRYYNRNQSMNTYATSIFHIYNGCMSNFLFHYGDALQVGILLTRMRLFSPLLSIYFTASPKYISLAFFFICLLIDFPLVFTFKVGSLGKYYYEDSSGTKRYETFYFMVNSDFAMSPFGQIFGFVTSFCLNTLFSLIVGIVLNVISFAQYKFHLNKRREQTEAINMRLIEIVNVAKIANNLNDQLSEKDKNARDAEKNMLYMVLSLCSISIVTGLVIICSIPYFLFYYSFSGSLTLMVVFITIYTLVPTVSIFIFYSFNKIYREEFNRILFSRNFFYSKTFAILPPPFRNRYLTVNFSFPIRKCIN
jgi:hypothetical protein